LADTKKRAKLRGLALMLNPNHITHAEFRTFAESHEGKYEFVDGRIVAQSAPTKAHQRIAKRLLRLLDDHVEPRGCEALGDSALALSPDSDDEREPDILVSCDPDDLNDADERRFRRPRLIIEILSQSSAGTDTNEKLLEYQKIPSVEEYLVLDSRKRRAVVYVRDERQLFVAPRDFIRGTVHLESIDYTLDIDALYDRARIT
jgi:Uma2 family endonuclease